MKKNKKQITFILFTSILFLAFLAFSYYIINLNNENKEFVTASAANVSIIYTDCAKNEDCANINKDLKPGESVTKTFKVENTGTTSAGFDIIFKNLANTFVNNELVYTILDENDEVLIPEKTVPYGTSEGLTIFSDNISKNKTKSYKMVVTFKEYDRDQEANKTATYNIELGIRSSLTVAIQNTFAKLQSLNNSLKINSVTPNFANISPMPSRYQDNGISGEETSWKVTHKDYYLTYGDDYIFNEYTGRYTLKNPKTCIYEDCYSELAGKYYCHNSVYDTSPPHHNSNEKDIYQITSNTNSSKIFYRSATKTVLEYDDKDSGLFEEEDNYGPSLYFRGNVLNNYVKFAKNSNNQDMYWRIIRINGDGSLRIIYDGTTPHENGESSSDRVVGNSTFNSSAYDAGYVGYMYGTFSSPLNCSCTDYLPSGGCIYTCTGGGSVSYEEAHKNENDSVMKTYLDNWYEENIIETGFSSYVSDEIFCSNRTIKNETEGFGQNYTEFAYERLRKNKNPSLICPNKNDSFTSNDSVFGNADLKYPVGLITADEISFGGFVYSGDINYKSYLYKGVNYWGMSPDSLWTNNLSYVTSLNTYLTGTATSNSFSLGVAPVINLSLDAIQNFTGDGTITNPFQISV